MDKAVSLLVGIIVGVVSAYFSGYSHKKGENLATKQDIQDLTAQTALLTQTAKEIESTISDKMWDRQKRWELKRDQVLLVTLHSSKIRNTLIDLGSELRKTDSDRLGRISEKMDVSTRVLNDLESAGMTAALVCSQKLHGAVYSFIEITQTIVRDMLEGNHQALSEKVDEFSAVHIVLLRVCREELSTTS